jgi:hypothetical protein
MTATRLALPFLKAADIVDITVIDPPPHGPERSDPGGLLCQMLVRHGIKAGIESLPPAVRRAVLHAAMILPALIYASSEP